MTSRILKTLILIIAISSVTAANTFSASTPSYNPVILYMKGDYKSVSQLSDLLSRKQVDVAYSFAPHESKKLSHALKKADLIFTNYGQLSIAQDVTKLQSETAALRDNKPTVSIENPPANLNPMFLRQAGIKIIFDNQFRNDGYELGEYGIARITIDHMITQNFEKLPALITNVNSNKKDPTVVKIDITSASPPTLANIANALFDMQKAGAKFITPRTFYHKVLKQKQYVVVRLDDYQTPWEKTLFENEIKSVLGDLVPQSVAVVPQTERKISDDPEAVSFLRDMVRSGHIEVTMHGYNHSDHPEFKQPLQDQIQTLQQALSEFKSILPYYKIRALIPPYNQFNSDTSIAMRKINEQGGDLDILASNFPYQDKIVFGFDDQGIYHLSRTIDTVADWKKYNLRPVEEVIDELGDDDGVLMLHPWLHKGEGGKGYLRSLVKKLQKKSHVRFVTMVEFFDEVTQKLGIDQVIAETAWSYFEKTRLPETGLNYVVIAGKNKNPYYHPYITPWDIGSTLIGIVTAHKLGLIDRKQTVERVWPILETLRTMELYKNLPNTKYNVKTGQKHKEKLKAASSGIGRLLLGLKLIGDQIPEFNTTVNSIVSRYKPHIVKGVTYIKTPAGNFLESNAYSPYFAQGFIRWNFPVSPYARLQFEQKRIDDINLFIPKDPTVPNRKMPYNMTAEPYFLARLEFGGDAITNKILKSLYDAQENRFRKTGIPTAIAEGSIDKPPYFVYFGAIDHNNNTWQVSHDLGGQKPVNKEFGFTSTKAVFALDAIYKTDYTSFLKRFIRPYIIQPLGIINGIYENNTLNRSVELNTQAIILEAIFFSRRGKTIFQ